MSKGVTIKVHKENHDWWWQTFVSWSENYKHIILIFWSEPLYQSLYCKNHMLNHNNLFTVIDSFQRYIHSDKNIVLDKDG
jgi:hypothetical protein